MSSVKQIQVAYWKDSVLTAPLQGPVTLDVVFSASLNDVDAIATAVEAAFEKVPQSSNGWERLDRSRSPFQKTAGIKTLRDFYQHVRLILLTLTDEKIVLERFIPFTGGKRGFVIDEEWGCQYSRETPWRELAICIARTGTDHTWQTRAASRKG